ncbi:MAG TPA: hypothetical protein VHF26_00685, partial [Trebonia sp.]|nr:hypothetical protein [Trebonia sp.]
MTWDSTDISDRHDAGTSGYDADGFGTADGPGEPGPGGSGRGTWAGIGIALALIGAIAATVVVWLAHVQAGAQGPQVTYAGARGVPTASAAGADAAGAGGTSSAAGGDAAGAGGTSGAASGADGTSSGSSSPLNQVDQAWAARAATATGISDRAFLAYASADLTIGKEQPGCGLGWNTLAAIGTVESANGTYGRATVLPDGYTSKPITGVPLDGGTFGGSTLAAIPASGNGTSSGWARAEGPFQFLPSTWARWGA